MAGMDAFLGLNPQCGVIPGESLVGEDRFEEH